MISQEMLYAYLDGELDGKGRRVVERALESDPALRTELEAQRALRQGLTAHFDPVLEEQVPPRLSGLLSPSNVISFQAARERRKRLFGTPHFAAMAASLAIGILGGQLLLSPSRGVLASDNGVLLARGDLAQTLETQLASTPPANAHSRIGLTFKDRGGRLCRTFESPEWDGIACRDGSRWSVVAATAAARAGPTQYRQASSSALLQQTQEMMEGEPLDAGDERRARDRGWEAE